MTAIKAWQLFNKAFDRPRDPRSPEYKAGVRASLVFRLRGVPIKCPHPVGTAAADAFFSGIDEGNRIWRKETGQ